MSYGAVKHTPKKIKAAFWRGAPKGMNKRVTIRVEIGRSMRWHYKYPAPRSRGAGYAASACIVGGKERRCTYAEGRSPTLAFKGAVRKLMKKTK